MGGSVGKLLGAVAGIALAPVTGGASLLYGLGGAAAGEMLVDKPAREAAKAQDQAAAQAKAAQEQAKQEAENARIAAAAAREQTATGTGVVARQGATALGEQDAKDKRGAVKKKKQGAAKLRIDPLASTGTGAATGTATTSDTGLKV